MDVTIDFIIDQVLQVQGIVKDLLLWFNSVLREILSFMPPFVRSALLMFLFVLYILVLVKIVAMVFNFVLRVIAQLAITGGG